MVVRTGTPDIQELPVEVGIGSLHILFGRVAVRRPDEPPRRVVDEASDVADCRGHVLCHRGRRAVLSILLVYACEAMEKDKACIIQRQ